MTDPNLHRIIRLGERHDLRECELIFNDVGCWLYWRFVRIGLIYDPCYGRDRFWWWRRKYQAWPASR